MSRRVARWRCVTAAVMLLMVTASVGRTQATVTSLSSLNFGAIVAGTTTNVAPTSASAMSFRIQGKLGINGGFTLTMPSSLTRVGGGASLPIMYCSTCGTYRVNNSNPVGGTTFNPSNGVLGLVVLLNSDVYVWVGGSVAPPLQQAAGAYTGTAVITIAPIL